MKNFSTGVARSLAGRTVIAVAAAWLLAGTAQAATECKFRPNAPDKHVVVKRDTLWDISGKFLEHPWCWPQVWGMNKDEIHNPHWIYPGQIVYFDRAHGRLTLNRPDGMDGAGDPGVTRMSPQIRTEQMGVGGAIQSVSRLVIDGLISKSLIVEAGALEKAPHIVATGDVSRIYLGKGDRIYVRGDLGGVTEFQVFHPDKPLLDPDTGKVMAYEAVNVGTVRLVALAGANADVHTFEITDSVSELGIGDRLRPVTPMPALNYAPHPPERPLQARVMSLATDAVQASQAQIVTVNRGALDGLDVGSVLVLYHPGQSITDAGEPKRGLFGLRTQKVRLPDEEVGNLFIFRVFQHVSYGLIMESKKPIAVGDKANSPE